MKIGIVILRCVVAAAVFGVIGFFVTPWIAGQLTQPSDNSGLDSWAWAFQGLLIGAFAGVAAGFIYSFIRRRSL